MPWNTNLFGTPLNIAAYTGTQLRVVAGPGTGKTYALTRIIHEGAEIGGWCSDFAAKMAVATMLVDLPGR
jgi:hypothetical protein